MIQSLLVIRDVLSLDKIQINSESNLITFLRILFIDFTKPLRYYYGMLKNLKPSLSKKTYYWLISTLKMSQPPRMK